MDTAQFFLNPRSIRTHVPEPTFERGMSLYITQQVMSCTVAHSNSNEWEIEGTVQGSKREAYNVSAMVEIDPAGNLSFFKGDCSCPVGDNCKHAVALTVKAAFKSARPNTGSSTSGGPAYYANAQPVPVAPTPQELQQKLEAQARAAVEREITAARQRVSQWLDLFGKDTDPDAAAPVQDSALAPPAEEHVVYILTAERQGHLTLLNLGFGYSKRLRNGNWAKLKLPRYGQLHNASADDTEIVRLIQGLGRNSLVNAYSAGDKAPLAGETGRLALELAANTGHLFDLSAERVLGTPIRLGAPRPVRWAWSEATTPKAPEPLWALRATLGPAHGVVDAADDGLVAGVAGFAGDAARRGAVSAANSPASAHWYPNTPPLYLDSARGECGPVEVPGLSAQHLALLLKAPPIPQSAFALHETTLLRRLAGLPLPPVLKAPVELKGIVPTAQLKIERVRTKDVAQLGLLCARLRFDYDGLRYYNRLMHSPVIVEQTLAFVPGQFEQPDQPAKQADKADANPRDNPDDNLGHDLVHALRDSAGTGSTPSGRVMLHRDIAKEQAAAAALHAVGLTGNARGDFHLALQADQHQWLRWADDGFAPLREAGFKIELDPALKDWIARADTLDVSMAPQGSATKSEDDMIGGDDSHNPWFDLSLGMQINGQRHNILPFLPELLAQLGSASTDAGVNEGGVAQLPPFVYVQQAEGNFLRLPTEPLRPWLQALLDLVGERGHDLSGDSLRLSRLEALRLGAALGQGAQWQGADSLREMLKQLGGISSLPEVPLPAGLNAELRPYQQQGLNWLQFLRTHGLCGILADDMGLGKTLQTLAHILVEKQAGRLDRPALVFAPVSLMGNWRREANRFTPDLNVLVLHGADRHEAAGEMATQDLIIAPYSLLKRDRERWLNQAWHIVVLDEAQNIKNANTDAAQVVGELNTRHRLCLSGTPMENHLGELWSLYHFLMPGFLGSQARFKQLFRTPIEKLGNNERLDQLRRRVTPFMLRRAKSDVATDLPPKQTAVSSVELGGAQADLYETIRLTTEKAVREALANKGLAKSQIQILDALLKLRQVCCDPRLVPLAAAKKIKESAKLELLMDMLPEMLAEGRRILLFSQFTSMLELIEEELLKRDLKWVKLTGQSQKRDALIEQFTSGEVPLFLISLKAGGVGLNLPQADTVIHYDPWWNPAVENQATDRAHRIGQTQSVFVYKLVAQGTIEERILALQARKAMLADSLYSGAQGRKQPLFTEDDVAELLKPLSVNA
jgi:superfamily II DNA or RNA helicase